MGSLLKVYVHGADPRVSFGQGDASASGFGADSGAMNEPRITIAKHYYSSGNVGFGFSPSDARHHCHIIGKTGSGKTALLRNLILQHIAQGHGVGVIDPHGDLVESLLEAIPPERTRDLLYFHPGDRDHPVGLNPLAGVLPAQRPLIVSGIIEALKNLWPDSWGPRMEYILQNAISALLHVENASLLGINRLLTDAAYRRWVVRQVTDPFVRKFWEEEYESYDARFRREAIAPIQNKLGQFCLHPLVRNVLGQVKARLSLSHVMEHSQIFLANLSKGQLGADKSALIGSLLVSQFQAAAMARATLPEEERKDFFLFIDEFQHFTTEAFASLLAEARKYRLNLTLSHQYLDQLSEPVRTALFGNVGSTICFRVGYRDAEWLCEEFEQTYSATQFLELGRFAILARLTRDNQQDPPIRGRTYPPIEGVFSDREKLIRVSRERFGMPREVIEDKLHRWLNS